LIEDIVQSTVTGFAILPLVLRLYNKPKPNSLNNQEFGAWLSGFIDAEGNFQVFFDRVYLRVAFRINLHHDDVEVLYKIKEYLGAGSVEKHTNSSVFVIRNVKVLLDTLVPILATNPLHTVKYFDYLDFKRVLLLLNSANSTVFTGVNRELVLEIIKGMNRGRVKFNMESQPIKPINKFWFLGFIEGEGTFGMKNLVPYFQIGQHDKSSHVMTKIGTYLSTMPNLFGFTLNSPSLKANVSTHKSTNVIVYSYHNIDSLHDILAYFLLDLPFQTRKYIDFLY